MNDELRDSRTVTGKRGSSALDRSERETEYNRHPEDHYNRVLDHQRVPSSAPVVYPSPVKRPRPSLSSSSATALRMKSNRAASRSNSTRSSSDSKLKMAELLAIKRELTVIKVQIDGLLDCVDKMDRQRKDCSGSGTTQPDSFLSLTDQLYLQHVTDVFTPTLKPNQQPENE
ncbi:RNA-binding Raly-like protein [Etheostoma cragini]|uniref:RNA-binding Raly-like protein n=1 Tax=Etheostoma cragini TaxID=417921 RepID=UPI00155DDFA5|nr:RNA-binding Raly-like protein [Etheostoma cragini]